MVGEKWHTETERETDGRWIAEVLEVPGALAYGRTELEAIKNAWDIARAETKEDSPK